MSGAPTKILQSIAATIRGQLRLRQDQVVLARQKFDIPPTGDLLVVLSLEDPKVIGNNSRVVDSGIPSSSPALGMRDEQYLTVRDLVQIDVLAMTVPATGANAARDLRNQVLIALMSAASEQAQEKLSYSLARVPVGFANTSALEETEYLERYTATMAVTYSEAAESFPDYFDGFGAEFIENDETTFTSAPPADAFQTTGG